MTASIVAGQEQVDFTRDIRPLISDRCFKCHGPDEAARKAKLRLDTEAGGHNAIEPGKPEASELFRRINAADEAELMPPPDSGLSLSREERDLLRRWIEQGAEYRRHWSFNPIRRPQPLQSGIPSEARAGQIDAFVLHRLKVAGLKPSPEADRATLARRVYLDLIGLPPTPADVSRYLNDSQPGAYERMVDRVLADPHFGEKWGRHWLDQARYADTHGYTVDSARSMWPYRDWVLRAINSDQPFDRFTLEQIAGDLLPAPSQEQLIATGFHRNTLVNQEGGTDREQFRNEAVVDRVNTTGAVWLGLTVGCAQCHTHKYDPLTQHDYYRLFAFFNHGQDVNSVSPSVTVASQGQQQQLRTLDAKVAQAQSDLKAFDQRRNESRAKADQVDDRPVKWAKVNVLALRSAGGATFETLTDGSHVVGGANRADDVYTIEFEAPVARITGLRLETPTHPSLPQGGPGRAANGNFVLNEVELAAAGNEANWLHATADHSQKGYEVPKAVDGNPDTGWAINGAKRLNVKRTAVFVAAPVSTPDQSLVVVRLRFGERPPHYNIGRFRLAVTDAATGKLGLPDADRAPYAAALKQAQDARNRFAKSLPTTMIMRDLAAPRKTHVHIRGDFLRKGDAVQAAAPDFLPKMPPSASRRTRLDLAHWLVDRGNPLTARVTVNRIWLQLFGRGLVETENDFGLQGTPPTHPELLDWLASEFMDNDWSVKRLVRLIVQSATYRQSSAWREDLAEADPLNKLMARQARLRVDAEIVRDLALRASGLLDEKLGGRSVYPPQPAGVYAFTQRRASWPTSKGADRYRRGMYTFFMRSAPHPMLTTFDAPNFNTTCTRRPRSNTPLQSLTLANDEAFVEFAQALGRRLHESGNGDPQRIRLAYRFCFSRPPTDFEGERVIRFLEEQRKEFRRSPADATEVSGAKGVAESVAVERAVWTMVARLLFNLDEFITRE